MQKKTKTNINTKKSRSQTLREGRGERERAKGKTVNQKKTCKCCDVILQGNTSGPVKVSTLHTHTHTPSHACLLSRFRGTCCEKGGPDIQRECLWNWVGPWACVGVCVLQALCSSCPWMKTEACHR